jgi:subtilisin family serine protease
VTVTTGTQQVRSQKSLLGLNGTLDGSGVTIAVLDSGIDSKHKSFATSGKIKFSKDFTGENRTDDPWGHGTHVAAIAAGEGAATNGAYEGIAPAANLINLRVLNSEGIGRVSNVLAALDWLVANKNNYNVRVVNMSLGTTAINSYENDPLCNAVRKLVNSGVVVVAAAGNNGKDARGRTIYGAIHNPGNEPSAITAGASNSFGADPRSEDLVTTYSSRGPTRSFSVDSYGRVHYDNLIKPDLVAPGNKIISAQAAGNGLARKYPELETNKYATTNMKLMYLSGTSMSAPMVSGAAALLLEANSSLTLQQGKRPSGRWHVTACYLTTSRCSAVRALSVCQRYKEMQLFRPLLYESSLTIPVQRLLDALGMRPSRSVAQAALRFRQIKRPLMSEKAHSSAKKRRRNV